VTDSLTVRLVVTVTMAKRTASSACCGAKLNPGAEPGTFTCRACGQPCERVLSGPEEVTAHG
jgi:Zn finger protein HypA/HybF involved in hydrogenase expression